MIVLHWHENRVIFQAISNINMRTILLIFNPTSDRHRAAKKLLRMQRHVGRNANVTWVPTEHAGHAVTLAATAQEYDVVAAIGGDGTVHEVINGLMQLPAETRPALGVVPIGSGNDLAMASGIPNKATAALDLLFSGQPQPLDVGRITDQTGRTEYWDNTCGMLMIAAMNIQYRKITRLYGFPAYLLSVIRGIMQDFHITNMTLSVDDAPTETKALMLFSIGNGPREGGGFFTNPPAKNNDGRLNYVQAPALSRAKLLSILPSFLNARPHKYDFLMEAAFKTLKFTADRPVPIHLDGEVWGDDEHPVTEALIEVLPGAINLIR